MSENATCAHLDMPNVEVVMEEAAEYDQFIPMGDRRLFNYSPNDPILHQKYILTAIYAELIL